MLARAAPRHAGLLLVYLDNKPSDMNTAAIVAAIANVEANYPAGLGNQIVVLNQFNWPAR